MKGRRIVIWVAVIVSAILLAAAWTWMRERQGYVERKLIVDRQRAAIDLGFLSYLNQVKRIDSCSSSGIDLNFFSGSCSRNDAILVSIPKEGMSGSAEFKASEYAGFKVGGKFRNTARIDLSESQANKLREEIISKVPGIAPLGSDGMDGQWTSMAFEACVNGKYYAARSDSEHRDEEFEGLERTLMTTLDVERMWSPKTPELFCM